MWPFKKKKNNSAPSIHKGYKLSAIDEAIKTGFFSDSNSSILAYGGRNYGDTCVELRYFYNGKDQHVTIDGDLRKIRCGDTYYQSIFDEENSADYHAAFADIFRKESARRDSIKKVEADTLKRELIAKQLGVANSCV